MSVSDLFPLALRNTYRTSLCAMATRPPELSMDATWEAAIDLTLRRLVYGSLAGGAAGLMFFRASPSYASRPTPRRWLFTRDANSLTALDSRLTCSPFDHLVSLSPGGAGTRSASLAFGAGAALGSAYTGTHPLVSLVLIPLGTHRSFGG